jgi:uncharacterized protein YggE
MKRNITIKLSAWIICAFLLLANLITISVWQPWNNSIASARTIVVTGTAIINSEPDQFVFSPYYQEDGADKTMINTDFNNLSKTITSNLRILGVKNSAIKVDINLYNYNIYKDDPGNNAVATMALTIAITDKDLAQKVQDYLVTTSPSGSITPQISFSVAKQKVIETQARDESLIDAKSKAESSAKQLKVRLGRVAKVGNISSDSITPLAWMSDSPIGATTNSTDSSNTSSSYTIQPGLNDYGFKVEVTYEIN